MKKIVLLFSFVLVTVHLFAQSISNDPLSKKEIRDKKKLEKETELQIKFESIYQILLYKSFVIELNAAHTPNGHLISINPKTNFLSVDSAISIFQSGNDSRLGANGVGGLTLKGDITKYVISKNNKHKECSLSMIVSSKIGHYIADIQVSSSGSAEVWINGTNHGSGFKIIGQFVPLKASNIFKGTTF